MLHPWVQLVQERFSAVDNPRSAAPMSAYMKNLFPFHGITSQHRADLLKDLLSKENLPQPQELREICEQLWQLTQREYVYAALTLMSKMQKHLSPSNFPWIIALITQKSWWDSVDTLAGNVLSTMVTKHPDTLWPTFEPLIASDNFGSIAPPSSCNSNRATKPIPTSLPQPPSPICTTRSFFSEKPLAGRSANTPATTRSGSSILCIDTKQTYRDYPNEKPWNDCKSRLENTEGRVNFVLWIRSTNPTPPNCFTTKPKRPWPWVKFTKPTYTFAKRLNSMLATPTSLWPEKSNMKWAKRP